MTHLDRLHPRRDLGREVVVDTVLHQQPRRRRAPLPVERELHEDSRVQRLLHVRIVEHDAGILATKLEM